MILVIVNINDHNWNVAFIASNIYDKKNQLKQDVLG